mmetsp:Transcript_114173/g.254814  ORF Transcript_114173/g.254814 Transcript_114173/m.254814 type:complete len:517 (+) Transcript_114173:67-1617(+)
MALLVAVPGAPLSQLLRPARAAAGDSAEALVGQAPQRRQGYRGGRAAAAQDLASALAAVAAAPTLGFTVVARRRRRLRQVLRGPRSPRALPKPDPESLRWALELAVRAEDFEEAARIHKSISTAEVASPVLALEGLVRDRVRRAVAAGLEEDARTEARLEAVKCLQVLATPPAASEEAEDGLHRVLREGDDDEVVEAAEAALWAAWLPWGEEVVDMTMRRGLKFMGAGELDKALVAFTEVVKAAPQFAEGWNKRATALFLAERFEESIEDCHRVLELKPRHFGCLSGLGICCLRQGDERSAVRWLRSALEVNPRSSDMQRIVADLEARSAASLLRPRIKEVLAELKAGGGQAVRLPEAGLGAEVSAAWDACRVGDLEPNTYFFRVRVKNLSGEGCRVEGTARYYALQDAGGSVFPLSRLTQGPGSFTLGPGESYFYSFMLTLAEELLAAQGGLFLRRCTASSTSSESSEAEEEPLFEAGLERIALREVPTVQEDDLLGMNSGYNFMGRVEIKLGGD